MDNNILAKAKTATVPSKTDAQQPIRKVDPKKTCASLIKAMLPAIKMALPNYLTPDRFTRCMLSAVSNNPKLAQCTTESLLGAMMNAAQLGLEPNTPLGHAYLIPYWNKNKGAFECQYQTGYQGLLELATRSGELAFVDAQAVRANDEFEIEYGLEPKLRFKPAMHNRGEVVGYYGIYKTKLGGYGFLHSSREDMEAYRQQYSPASKKGSSSPWDTDFDAMAKKTMIKQVLKYAPKRADLVKAVTTDSAVLNIGAKDITDSLENGTVKELEPNKQHVIDVEADFTEQEPSEETGQTKPPAEREKPTEADFGDSAVQAELI